MLITSAKGDGRQESAGQEALVFPGDEPEDPWQALPLDRLGTDGVYEGPISSRDLAKGVWSGDLPSINSDGEQA